MGSEHSFFYFFSLVFQVTADHPEVKVMVEAAIKAAEEQPITIPPETYIEIMEQAITDKEKERRLKNPEGPL